MKQKTLTTTLLLMLTVTLFTGCNSEPPRPQAVVIELHAISEAMNINEHIKKHMETMNQQTSEEIKALSDKLSKEIEDEKASLGDSPSKDDERKIQTLQEQQHKQIKQTRITGNARRAKEISEIKQSFLNDIMLVAQKVALEHGASIILIAKGVFWSDETVDITDEVIEQMLGNKDTQPVDGE